jgi:peptidylprolyl isomerase
MSEAKSGDTVRAHYTETLQDGTQFDSSHGRDPIEFTLGDGEVLSGFETAVEGMSVGDTKRVTVPAEEAYGPRRDDLAHEVPRDVIPDNIELTEGMALLARGPDGQNLTFTVVDFDDQKVKIDGIHPLAGKDLASELELMEIA